MHPAAGLRLHSFGASDPLAGAGDQPQIRYLRRYLGMLGAQTILEEPNYFDKDYLSEFAAFYSTSSTGYSNACRRLHFFSVPVARSQIEAASGGEAAAAAALQSGYLGFTVLRPIPAAPLGRTVLPWFPEDNPLLPRVTEPARPYFCHIAGIRLSVVGLAWQQQDSAVGACATVALWTSLHSSAFNGYHAVPTTAGITRAAHRALSFGSRIFPSAGLNVFQLCEVIKEHGLSPLLIPGDVPIGGAERRFSRAKFTASCSSMLRSGYPVIVGCAIASNPHAVCLVGFRSAAPPAVQPGDVAHHDGEIPYVYLHDDNLGPNVRCRIADDPSSQFVVLHPSAPSGGGSSIPDATAGYPDIVPNSLVVAVPDEIRASPDSLHRTGAQVAGRLSAAIAAVASGGAVPIPGLVWSTRFIRLKDYVGAELGRLLAMRPACIGRTRLDLWEKVRPMSLHLGIVRVGVGPKPILDVVYDTTDSDRNRAAFAHIVFARGLEKLLGPIDFRDLGGIGTPVIAYDLPPPPAAVALPSAPVTP